MSQNLLIPDLGDATEATVIEVCVAVGDRIQEDMPLLVLEGDKASMEVPATTAGTVTAISVRVGETVTTGHHMLTIDVDAVQAMSPQAPQAPVISAPIEAVETLQTVYVPDLGDGAQGTVLEITAQVGDSIAIEAPLVTLEGEKATMDLPSPFAGTLEVMHVVVGQVLETGHPLCQIRTAHLETVSSAPVVSDQSSETVSDSVVSTEMIQVPDLGEAQQATVIDVHVKVGQSISEEAPLLTLEGEKATMDIPSPFAGEVAAVLIQVGDVVSTGQAIVTLEGVPAQGAVATSHSQPEASPSSPPPAALAPSVSAQSPASPSMTRVYAGPAVRGLARRLGVDLAQVKGSGHKGRITPADLEQYVSQRLKQPGGISGFEVAPWPKLKTLGPVRTVPLSKIKQASGRLLHRNWVQIPHVTQFDEADFTELEVWRKAAKARAKEYGCGLSPLVLVMKVLVEALKAHPEFNASLSEDGRSLVLKSYYHMGIAVDSPQGLVVPVIRDVDQKDLVTLSQEISTVAAQAREKGLSSQQMQGSSFTVSSLGGVGGTAFTPIVNAPDVAILGLSKTYLKPVYQEEQWMPRLMLPLSLSYDHRAIDGAQGARFTVDLGQRLANAHLEADNWWPA